jgi:hypothetical protein
MEGADPGKDAPLGYASDDSIAHRNDGVQQGIREASSNEAHFPDGVIVQVRPAGAGRWELWVGHGASDHARRIAEHWYGQPIGGWNTPKDRVSPPRSRGQL